MDNITSRWEQKMQLRNARFRLERQITLRPPSNMAGKTTSFHEGRPKYRVEYLNVFLITRFTLCNHNVVGITHIKGLSTEKRVDNVSA